MGQILDRAEFLAKSDLEKSEEFVEKMRKVRLWLFGAAASFCLLAVVALDVGFVAGFLQSTEISVTELLTVAVEAFVGIMVSIMLVAFAVTIAKALIYPRY